MMKMSRMMALSLIFSLGVSSVSVSAMNQSVQEQKSKTFWQRHKGKLKAGLVVAGFALTAALAYFHANKTMNAIQEAGISKDDPEYVYAIEAVGLLGPLGAKNTLWTLKKAVNQKLMTAEQAAALVFSNIGAALAHYFGLEPSEFKTMAVTEGIREVGRKARDTVKKALEGVKNFLGA